MVNKALLLFLLVLIIGLYNGVEGKSKRRNLLEENEDLQLEKQLNIFNKPPIKTIQTENGDTFDCVDIHKQPALDHPLLKHHKIQMRPSSRPKGFDDKIKSNSFNVGRSVLKPLGCPKGTVPIRRTTKKGLIRAKPFFESYNPSSSSSSSSIHPQTVGAPGEHLAIRRSLNTTDTFYGVYGYINTAVPKVGNDQFSSGQMWVEGGPPDKKTTLQAGWAVAPQIFQDDKPRLFVYSNSDASPKGCYNLLCEGFVQVHGDFAIGQELVDISEYGGTQYVMIVSIYKADDAGSWWLGIGPPDNMKDVGYWPGEIYSQLTNGASYVAWGGLVKGTSSGPSPQMGNGHFPEKLYKEACSVVKLEVMYSNSNFTFVNPKENEFENYIDQDFVRGNAHCYGIKYDGNLGEQGYSFLFGGPGGDNCGV